MSNGNENTKKKSAFRRVLDAIGGDKLILLGAIILVFAVFTFLNKNFLFSDFQRIT